MEKSIKLALIYLAVTLSVYLSFKFIIPLILPFIVSYLIALIIRPITDFLSDKLKLPRIVSATIALIILLILFSISIFYLFKIVVVQLVSFIKNMPIFATLISSKLEKLCQKADTIFGFEEGLMNEYIINHLNQINEYISSNFIPKVAEGSFLFLIKFVSGLGIFLIIIIASLLIVKDMILYKERYRNSKIYKKAHKLTEDLAKAGLSYLKAQGIIGFIVAVICTIGMILIRSPYSFLIGIIIGVVDAVPILGSGFILVPWSILLLIQGEIYYAAILMTTFLICQILRQILEPRLLGEHIGINSIYMLMSIYVGIKIFSIAGFILGPLGLIVIITIIKSLRENINLT